MPAPVAPIVSGTPPTPDPRVGLKAGYLGRGSGAWNMKLHLDDAAGPKVLGATHSDLAFTGKYAIQGNYNGFEIYDISNPAKPVLVNHVPLPGVAERRVGLQEPAVHVVGSRQQPRGLRLRRQCPMPVSKERVRGIRIFDITDVEESEARDERADLPRIAHAHRRHAAGRQGQRLHLRLRARRACVRQKKCRAAWIRAPTPHDPNTARFRLEVIKVPLAAPQKAAITNAARIFQSLPVAAGAIRSVTRRARARRRGPRRAAAGGGCDARRQAAVAQPLAARRRWCGGRPAAGAGGAARGGRAGAPAGAGRGGRGRAGRRPDRTSATTSRCIRTSVSPAARAAVSACCSTSAKRRIRSASTSSATRTCRSGTRRRSATTARRSSSPTSGAADPRRAAATTDKLEWGANALFTIENNKMVFKSYYKMPAAQTDFGELRRAQRIADSDSGPRSHGAGVLPGRPLDVRLDRCRRSRSKSRIFDRGPLDADAADQRRLVVGLLVQRRASSARRSSRGLDIFELVPSPLITQNEIDAAKTVKHGLLEHAGAAPLRVAAELRDGARVRRSARAVEGPERRRGSPRSAVRSTAAEKAIGRRAPHGADHARDVAQGRRDELERCREGADAHRRGDGPDEVAQGPGPRAQGQS